MDDVDEAKLFMEPGEIRLYQVPLKGPVYKADNRLVYSMLKAACIQTDAWAWIQGHDATYDGRKAWLALVGHYNGTAELNRRVARANNEIDKLHYKDGRLFSFEKYATKMKEAFQVIDKDPDDRLLERRKVEIFLKGISSTDASITEAKVSVLTDHRNDLDAATSFVAGLISTLHTSAQSEYGSRNSGGKRRYVSATDSRDSRGRGRARRGGDGRGRDGRGRDRGGGYGGGRGSNTLRKYMNGVDVSDPHRNFTSEEWTKLGSMRRTLLLMRQDSSGRGGRVGGRGDGQRSVNASNATSATATPVPATANTTNDQATHVSELTERGSQNGRGFGRGAYN